MPTELRMTISLHLSFCTEAFLYWGTGRSSACRSAGCEGDALVLVTACCTDGMEDDAEGILALVLTGSAMTGDMAVEIDVTVGALTLPATTAGLTMGVTSGVTVEGEVEIDTFGVALAGKAAEDSGT